MTAVVSLVAAVMLVALPDIAAATVAPVAGLAFAARGIQAAIAG